MPRDDTKRSGADESEPFKQRCPPRASEADDLPVEGTRSRMLTGLSCEDEETQRTRDFMLEVLQALSDRNDAFMTLPITSMFTFVFILLATLHLKITDRQFMETALEDWTNGRNPRTDAGNNVDDVVSFWEWVHSDSGLEGQFGTPRTSADNHVRYYIANRCVFFGDIQMEYEKFNGETETAWLLNSETGLAHLAANPGDHLGAAQATATYLQKEAGWDDLEIEHIYVRYVTYNGKAHMYAMVESWFRFHLLGGVVIRIDATSVSIKPYPNEFSIVIDVIYMLFLVKIVMPEVVDIFRSMRNGVLSEYFDFWNFVDWVSIILGFLSQAIWIWIVYNELKLVNSNALTDEGELIGDLMEMPLASIEAIHKQVNLLCTSFAAMHAIVALNTISIVMKFFKAFTSNPRLMVVINTLGSAANDFAHFGIIFSTIFLPFALIGHVLFGNDIAEFSSVFASVNTSFLVLMGEFGWYVDATEGLTAGASLPSGVPVLVLFIWYFAYMFLLTLVLLNMLLAIIITHYTNVTDGLKFETYAPPLWVQAKHVWRQSRETRGFISLDLLAALLSREDNPKHPQPYVTKESLMEAFDDMTEKQAEWLMRLLDHEWELRRKIREEAYEQDALNKTLDALNDAVSKEARNSATEPPVASPSPEGAPPVASPSPEGAPPMESPTKLVQAVKDLESVLVKIQRDQVKIGKRLDDIVKRGKPGDKSPKSHGP